MALAELTKNYIVATYRSLITELSTRQISIATITKACNINRKTFYYHFADIFDLNIWIFRSDLAKELQVSFSEDELVTDTELRTEKYRDLPFYVNSRSKSSPQDMGSFWNILSNCMHKNRAYYKKVLTSYESNQNNLNQYILKIYCIQIKKDILSNLDAIALPSEDVDFLASYFTNACVGWILNNVKAFLPDYFPANRMVTDIRFSNLTHTLIKLVTRKNTLTRMQEFTQTGKLELSE